MFEGRGFEPRVHRRFWVAGVHERLRDGRRRRDVGAAAHGQAARFGVSVLRAEALEGVAAAGSIKAAGDGPARARQGH